MRMRTREEKRHCKGSHSSSVSGSNRHMRLQNLEKSNGLVHCSVENAAVCAKYYRERVTQIELARMKKKKEKKKKEKHFGRLATFCFSTL